MSKPIKITHDILTDAKKEFEKQLQSLGAKMFDGKVTFSKTYKWKGEDKATVVFTPNAYLKMLILIREFSDEVAWHGVAYRDDEDDSLFHITDILVYPQEVTGATVTTDQVKYQDWLMSFEDDVFNNIRMQGHSHVNMSPNPSSTDMTHQEAILNELDSSMFYIFMIWNKSLSHNIKIFDMKNNTLYEDSDIVVKIASDEGDYDKFAEDAKELVQRKVYNYDSQQKHYSDKQPKAAYGDNSIGNGWKNRGMSALEDYYAIDEYGQYYGK